MEFAANADGWEAAPLGLRLRSAPLGLRLRSPMLVLRIGLACGSAWTAARLRRVLWCRRRRLGVRSQSRLLRRARQEEIPRRSLADKRVSHSFKKLDCRL